MTDSQGKSNGVVKNIRQEGDAVVIELAGDVDLHQAVGLRGCLLEALQARPKVMIVNMAGVDFMDSSGLATLVEALQLNRRNGGRLKLVGMKQRVRSIFEISRLESIFEIYQTESEALAS